MTEFRIEIRVETINKPKTVMINSEIRADHLWLSESWSGDMALKRTSQAMLKKPLVWYGGVGSRSICQNPSMRVPTRTSEPVMSISRAIARKLPLARDLLIKLFIRLRRN